MKIVPDQIRQWVPGRYMVLGTDGYGRSDGREALRQHFEVDRKSIVVTALKALADDGSVDSKTVAAAIADFGLDPEKPDPSRFNRFASDRQWKSSYRTLVISPT